MQAESLSAITVYQKNPLPRVAETDGDYIETGELPVATSLSLALVQPSYLQPRMAHVEP